MMNGTDQSGDEFGKRMVSGRDTLLWRSGICAGEDTRIKTDLRSTSVDTEQTSIRTLCPAGRKGTFDGRRRLSKVKLCVTFDKK